MTRARRSGIGIDTIKSIERVPDPMLKRAVEGFPQNQAAGDLIFYVENSRLWMGKYAGWRYDVEVVHVRTANYTGCIKMPCYKKDTENS